MVRLRNRKFLAYFAFLGILLTASFEVNAACTTPAGDAGQILFQTPDFLFCDGTSWHNLTSNTFETLNLGNGTTSLQVGIATPAGAGSYSLVLPNSDGNANQFLQTDGNGILTWATVASSEVRFPADTTAGASIAIGQNTLQQQDSLSANFNNTAVGYNSMSSASLTTSAANNTAMGFEALKSVTSGAENTAVGKSALPALTAGIRNTSIGQQSLVSVTSGMYNTGLGWDTGMGITTGNYNTAVGAGAIMWHGGSENTAVGTYALQSAGAGSSNTVLGYQAGVDITTGNSNIIIGHHSTTGVGVTTGTNNILIGEDVRPPSQVGNNQLNIGNLIYATGLATGATASTGNVGIGTTTPGGKLDVHVSDGSRILNLVNSGTTTDAYPTFRISHYKNNAAAGHPIIQSFAARGTEGAPNTVVSGMKLMSLEGRGYAEAGFGADQPGAHIDFIAPANWGNSETQADITFNTNSGAGWGTNERMRLTSKGNLGIGTTTPTRLLHVAGPMRLTASTTPATPAAGDIFIDSADSNKLKYYDGTSWVSLTGGGGGDFMKDGSVAMTGTFQGLAGVFTSNSTSALAVGPTGATNPAFVVDASAASPVTGLNVTAGTSGTSVTLQPTTSGDDLKLQSNGAANIYLNNAGGGTTYFQFSGVNRGHYSSGTFSFYPAPGPNMYTPFLYTAPANSGGSSLTASVEGHGAFFDMSANRNHATGALATQRDYRVAPSTHSFTGASTITNAMGFSVDNPPLAGANATITNTHGIYVGSANVAATGSVTNSYGMTVNAATGATNNYAAAFMGGNVGVGTTAPARQLHVAGPMRLTASTTPATPAAGDIFIDSADSNKLKYYDGTSWVSLNGGGGGDFMKDGSVAMTGSFKAVSGTAAAPGITFASDTLNDTGLYLPAQDEIGLSTGGSERLRVDATGRVGIGTAVPAKMLHLSTTTGAGLRMHGTNNNSNSSIEFLEGGGPAGMFIEYDGADTTTNGRLNVGQYGGSVFATFDRSGNVGIGNTVPRSKLEITNGTSGGNGLEADYTKAQLRITDGVTGGLDKTLAIGYDTWSNKGVIQAMNTTSAGTSLLLNPQGGNVGVGTITPTYRVEAVTAANVDVARFVSGSVGGVDHLEMKMTSATNNVNTYNMGINTTADDQWTVSSEAGANRSAISFADASAATDTYFGVASSSDSGATWIPGLVVKQSGNVGIGTSTSTHRLEVKSAAASSTVVEVQNSLGNKIWGLWETGGSNGEFHLFKNDGSRIVQLGSSNNSYFNGGNVGIGTTTPGALLHVAGPMRVEPAALPGTPAAGDIAIDSGASNALKYYNGTAWVSLTGGGGTGDVNNGGNSYGSNMTIGTNDNYRMQLIVNGGGSGKYINFQTDGDFESGFTGGFNLQAAGYNSSNPPYAFMIDDDTGMFWANNADTLGFATGGNERMRIDASGNLSLGGYAASGFLSASPVLYETGTASQTGNTVTGVGTTFTPAMVGSILTYKNSGLSAGVITAYNSPTSLTVSTSQTVASGPFRVNYIGFNVDNTGSVGIGTSSPSRKLHVNGPMRVEPAALPGTPAAGDIAIDSGASNALKYYNGTAWVSLTGGGGGTPGGADTQLQFNDGGSFNGDTGLTWNKTSKALTLTSSDANAFVVGQNGATNPALKIDTSTASSVSGLQIKSGASGSSVNLQAISSSANAGIGITSKGSGQVYINNNSTSGAITLDAALGSSVQTINYNTNSFWRSSSADNTSSPMLRTTYVPGNTLPAATEATLIHFDMSGTRRHNTGAIALQRDLRVSSTTHSAVAASTTTAAATLAVEGAPIAGSNMTLTNSSAIYVPTVAVNGGGTVTNSYGLNVAAATGATNNYAAAFTGGNVGIGTTSPARLLQVEGPMRLTASTTPASPAAGDIFIDSAASNALKYYNGSAWVSLTGGGGGSPAGANTQIQFNNSGSFGANANLIWDNTNNRLGVNTAIGSMDRSLVVSDGATDGVVGGRAYMGGWSGGTTEAVFTHKDYRGSNTSFAILQNNVGRTKVNAGSGQFIAFNIADVERMRLDSAGNFGIGTTTPGKILHVRADSSSMFERTNAATNAMLATNVFKAKTTGDMVDNFGPSLLFDIEDSAAVSNTIATVSAIRDGADNSGMLTLRTYNAGTPTDNLVINKTGLVGIGTLTPAEKLDVNGNVQAVAYLYSSDIRLKKDIEPIDNSLEKLLSLETVTFNWIEPKSDEANRKQLGLIAQEVQKVYPEAVTEGKDGYLKVNYPALIAPVIDAIRELYYSVTGLDQRTASLENEVENLKKENAELKEKLNKILDRLPAEAK